MIKIDRYTPLILVELNTVPYTQAQINIINHSTDITVNLYKIDRYELIDKVPSKIWYDVGFKLMYAADTTVQKWKNNTAVYCFWTPIYSTDDIAIRGGMEIYTDIIQTQTGVFLFGMFCEGMYDYVVVPPL